MRCLALPVRVFWVLASHVDRLRAQDQLEALDAATMGNAMGDPKARQEYRTALQTRVGAAVHEEKPRSREADILAIMR